MRSDMSDVSGTLHTRAGGKYKKMEIQKTSSGEMYLTRKDNIAR